MSDPDYELVRVSREMVDQLVDDESDPVVVVGLKRMEDGTCEMRLRTPEIVAEVKRLREALEAARACMEWCVNLGADEATAKSLRRGMAVAREALEAGGDR